MLSTIIGVILGMIIYSFITSKESRNAIVGLCQLKDYKGNKITKENFKKETEELIQEAEDYYQQTQLAEKYDVSEEDIEEVDDDLILSQMLPISHYEQALPGTEFAFYGNSGDVYAVLDIPDDAKHLFKTGSKLQDKNGIYTVTQTENGVVGISYHPKYCACCGKEIYYPITKNPSDCGILRDCWTRYCEECATHLIGGGFQGISSAFVDAYYDGFFLNEISHTIITRKDNPEEFYDYLNDVKSTNSILTILAYIEEEQAEGMSEEESYTKEREELDNQSFQYVMSTSPLTSRKSMEIEYLKHVVIAQEVGLMKGLE